jgi:hypothetical protein
MFILATPQLPSSPRLSFPASRARQEWGRLQQLLVDAGLLVVDKHDGNAEYHVDEERMGAMLALTAIHDLMKVEILLPTVSTEHAPFCGFAGGATINDHDIALGYVLDFYGGSLPSFAALPAAQQRSVRFTQSKMGFNHGWLVQAEAPPGALFGKFKHAIDSGGVESPDVAFYFVHWLTDLAGAVPTPLEGSEKFVLKFPHPVLGSFIRSFSVLNELANKTETEVFEQYLARSWMGASMGPLPSGDKGIALMRLVVQAQTEKCQRAVMEAFDRLPPADARVLSEEMARTGARHQAYIRSQPRQAGGPAILVYYSPAFVRAHDAPEVCDTAANGQDTSAAIPSSAHPPASCSLFCRRSGCLLKCTAAPESYGR